MSPRVEAALIYTTAVALGLAWGIAVNRAEVTPELALQAVHAVPCDWSAPIPVTDTPPRELYQVVCDTSVSMGGGR